MDKYSRLPSAAVMIGAFIVTSFSFQDSMIIGQDLNLQFSSCVRTITIVSVYQIFVDSFHLQSTTFININKTLLY